MKDYEYDNEMLYMIEESNEDAIIKLIEKYNNLLNICVKKHISFIDKIGADEKDLYQEGLLGLIEATNSYEPDKKVLFKTYATTCINNRIKSYIKCSGRKKHTYLNDSLSLDNVTDDEASLYTYTSKVEISPEEKIILNDEIKEICKQVKTELTDFEYKVFISHIKGFKNKEIAKQLNKNIKSIENTIQRIKLKLSKIKKSL